MRAREGGDERIMRDPPGACLCYSVFFLSLPPTTAHSNTGFVSDRNLSPEPKVWGVPGRVPGWLHTHSVYPDTFHIFQLPTHASTSVCE